MNIEATYEDILARLKRGDRPLIKLSSDDLVALKTAWKTVASERELHAILCILDNTQTLSQEFDELIIAALEPSTNDQTIIYTLSVASKHVIAARARSGDQIPARFIDALGELLAHQGEGDSYHQRF